MLRAKYLFVLLLLVVPCVGQVSLGGFGYVPSTTDSLQGSTNVTFVSDANCTLLTATNCTVVTAQGSTIGAPYTGSLNVTSSVALSAMRDLIAPLGPGKDYRVCNLTTGGQRVRVIGASGNGYIIYNGQCALVFTLGVDYYGIGGQFPVSPANGGTGQNFSAATGYVRADAGVFSTIGGVTAYCAGWTCPSQTGVAFTSGSPLFLTSGITNSSTQMSVASTAGWPSVGCGAFQDTSGLETICWDSSDATTFYGLHRGMFGTAAAAHNTSVAFHGWVYSYSSSTSALPRQVITNTNYILYGGSGSSGIIPLINFSGQVDFNNLAFFGGTIFGAGGYCSRTTNPTVSHWCVSNAGVVTLWADQYTSGSLGAAPIVYSPPRLTGQTAALAATTILCPNSSNVAAVTCVAGDYELIIYANTTTAGSGTMTITVTWDDGAGGKSDTSTATLDLSSVSGGTGYLRYRLTFRSSGTTNPTYFTTFSGGATGTYALTATMIRLK